MDQSKIKIVYSHGCWTAQIGNQRIIAARLKRLLDLIHNFDFGAVLRAAETRQRLGMKSTDNSVSSWVNGEAESVQLTSLIGL